MQQQVLRSITKADFMALELEELEALLQCGNAALVAKAKQTVQDCKEEASILEQKRQEEVLSMRQQLQTVLEFEPKLLECFAYGPVKLNVGGTYFFTSVATLTREPGTFFSAMFSGRWEIRTDPHDQSVFVDRDPAMFGMIVSYMRTGEIDLDDLNFKQLTALIKELDFYQIASLLKMLQSTFSPKNKASIQLSRGNSRVTHVEESESYVYVYAISLAAFSPSVREMKVKLIKGDSVMIGVAPKFILEASSTNSNCGWHIQAYKGSLDSQNGDKGKPFQRKINAGSVVAVKLDEEFNISFQVDGEDWGIAFPNVAKDYSVPLHLAITLYQPGDAVELL